jgi:aryl-alcohol dehydrogenase-like predicted oxidoreductase
LVDRRSNFTVAQIERAEKIAPVISLQPPYSLIHRQIETETLPYCEKQGIGVIVYSPMASGLLTGAMTHERAHRSGRPAALRITMFTAALELR